MLNERLQGMETKMHEMEEELREIRYYAVYGEYCGFTLKSIIRTYDDEDGNNWDEFKNKLNFERR